jgi:hypothetical protein
MAMVGALKHGDNVKRVQKEELKFGEREKARVMRAYKGVPPPVPLAELSLLGKKLEVRDSYILPEDPDLEAERQTQFRASWKVKVAPEGAKRQPNPEDDWKPIVKNSFNNIPISSRIRMFMLFIVELPSFDTFILLLICFNSVLMAIEQHRAVCPGVTYDIDAPLDPDCKEHSINNFSAAADYWLTALFTAECVAKVIAYGFIRGPGTYLADMWNWIDFVVVVTGIISIVAASLNLPSPQFLRVFRVMRPLRSLTVVPEMKKIVNTVLRSVPKLGNVLGMAMFLMTIFGILSLHFWGGVFFRACRADPMPTYNPAGDCFEFPLSGEADGRLCGGRYFCPEDGGHCAAGERKDCHCKSNFPDTKVEFRPVFEIDGVEVDPPWTSSTEAAKPTVPYCGDEEWDWQQQAIYSVQTEDYNFQITRFDNLLRAIMVIFQCITMEGWVDVMYMLQDAHGDVFASCYFVLLIIFGSFFLLNVALAVVWEAFSGLQAEQEDEEDEVEEEADAAQGAVLVDEPYWIDCLPVRFCRDTSDSDPFQNAIMFFIITNVVTMCMDGHPPPTPDLQKFRYIANFVFTAVFALEFLVLNIGLGPKKYWTNMVTGFDGLIVITSFIELRLDGSGAITAFRGFRLLRIFKLAKKWTSFRVLVKAMGRTMASMFHFSVVLLLMMLVFTLMGTTFFSRTFRFTVDADGHKVQVPGPSRAPYCPGEDENGVWVASLDGNVDCIPRAHFDGFLMAFVTVFQVLSGENWNTVMYDSMIGAGDLASVYFILLVVVGQLVFLNLFLAILMDNFATAKDAVETQEAANSEMKAQRRSILAGTSAADLSSQLSDTVTMDVPAAEVDPEVEALRKAEAEAVSSSLSSLKAAAKVLEKPKGLEPPKWPKDYSLLLFAPENPVRKACAKLVKSKPFDNFILFLIVISSLAMAVDNPLKNPAAILSQILYYMNLFCTFVFLIEMITKKIADGAFCGKNAYWRKGWNMLDGLVVTISVIDLLPLGGQFKSLKTLRVLRALRPLRVISRNPNLKLVIDTLARSLPELCNLLVVAGLFFLIFGLFSVAYFQGGFFTCQVVFEGDLAASDDVGVDNVATAYSISDEVLISGNWVSTEGNHGAPSWMCVDSNPISPSFGAAWAAPVLGVANMAYGESCAAFLDAIRESPGGNLPPPAQEADLKFWHRASSDTPICATSCPADGRAAADQPRPAGCPDPVSMYNVPDITDGSFAFDPLEGTDWTGLQVPAAVHPDGRRYEKGETSFAGPYPEWQAASTRWLMPCGDVTDISGTTIQGCRSRMCNAADGIDVSEATKQSCKQECEGVPGVDPFYCNNACNAKFDLQDSAACKSCIAECIAGCECSSGSPQNKFCERLQLDAGVCAETGGLWVNFNQNFDSIGTAFLTLIEIATTEGWVDVMYMAMDQRGPHMTPERDFAMVWSLFFVIFIFVGSFFILNLCVGVIVDNFSRMKDSGEQVLLTPFQQQYKESLKKMDKEKLIFGLTHLQELPELRRRVFFIVSSPLFENGIMACILLNSVVMAIKHFPEPEDFWYRITFDIINYIFAAIFFVEAVLKIFSLRWTYFIDNWNLFDFTCVLATIVGFVLQFAFKIEAAGVMNAIRLFRIARLFRLLRFAKGLNQLFNAFLNSIPAMSNVAAILLLFLFLFSVMGLHMFSKMRYSGPHSEHANFREFFRGFLTLFRSMTGEGWNELMHALSRNEEYFGKILMLPCVNDLESETEADWDLLVSRGLTYDRALGTGPIGCGSSAHAYIFFVAFTCLITFVILNLFVAVVLEGFEGTNDGDEAAIVSKCIEVWKRYDVNLTMMVPMLQAPDFIETVQEELPQLEIRGRGRIPIKSALLVLGHIQVTADAKVRFKDAVDGALRLILSKGDPSQMNELRAIPGSGLMELEDEEEAPPIVRNIAALRMQGAFRKRKLERQEKAEFLERRGTENAAKPKAEEADAEEDDAVGAPFPGAIDSPEEGLNKGDMPAAG